MAETSAGSFPHADPVGFPNGSCFLEDFSNSIDDFLFELIPSISENALPSTENLVAYLSQETPINSHLENLNNTDATKISSNPLEANKFSAREITQSSLDQTNQFCSNGEVVQSTPGDTESETSLFSKMMESLHNLDDGLDTFKNFDSSNSSHSSYSYKSDNATNLNEEEMSLQISKEQQNVEYLPIQSSTMLKPSSPQEICTTINHDTWQQTMNSFKTSHESVNSNDLPNSIKQLKLYPSQLNAESLTPIHKSSSTELYPNNSLIVQTNYSQHPTLNEQQGNKWSFNFNQPSENSQPNNSNQSQMFEQVAVRNYYSVPTLIEKQTMAGVKQIPNHSNETYKVATDQQSQTALPMNTHWQEFNSTKSKNESDKNARPFSITECHLEDFEKFPDVSFNQYREICRYDTPQSLLERVQKRVVPDVGGNQIYHVYNNTTHRASSYTNIPSQSCKDKNELSKEELFNNRDSVIIRNNSILGKRTEDCSGSGSYGEGTYEEIGVAPCKMMKVSNHDFDFIRGSNFEHNPLNLWPIEKIKCEVLDFSSSTALPCTSNHLKSVVETPLLREHRIIRLDLSALLERIDSVILQKGVKEKSPKTEELVQVDIHDEKKLKKSVDTLSSYFKEARSLYAKYEGREITKDELSREAKRLKNKFSGMKSRVKKKKEFICEKKEFFHLVHEFKRLKSLSDELENFQNVVVRELDNFNRSSPLGKFFLKTVFSQMHTSNIDSWIDADYSESVKKLENL